VIFTSFAYAAFLTVVVALNWLLPPRYRVALLVVASYAFYATWSIPAISILAVVTLITYGIGLAMVDAEGTRRTVLAAIGTVAAASTLLLFKVVAAFGFTHDGHHLPGVTNNFVIPVGLSFFSFQAISYVIDNYRREIEPSRSLIDVAAYLAFFPHLLAGPIVRAKKLIPAFHATPRVPNKVQWSEASELILVGVFKKVALADPLFALNVDALRSPHSAGTFNVLLSLATVLLGGYFDVTGYIDIARGSAKLLGIDMQRNSLMPLTASTGYADFWRRWQLTVMMWFRDYIYRPLRGDGRNEGRDTAALFGTFLFLGLWHGLSTGWLAWGIVSGVIIVIERSLQTKRSAKRRAQTLAARQARSRAALPKAPSKAAGLAIALLLVMATFPLVAANSLGDIVDLYKALVIPSWARANWDLVAQAVLCVGALVLVDGRERRRERQAGKPDPVNVARAAAFGLMVLAVVIYSGPAPRTFVYFHF